MWICYIRQSQALFRHRRNLLREKIITSICTTERKPGSGCFTSRGADAPLFLFPTKALLLRGPPFDFIDSGRPTHGLPSSDAALAARPRRAVAVLQPVSVSRRRGGPTAHFPGKEGEIPLYKHLPPCYNFAKSTGMMDQNRMEVRSWNESKVCACIKRSS